MVLKILLRLLLCGGDPGTCSLDASVISRNCSGNAAARIGGLVVQSLWRGAAAGGEEGSGGRDIIAGLLVHYNHLPFLPPLDYNHLQTTISQSTTIMREYFENC